MGEILWREAPVDADLVISVPDSGNPAAVGYARASGLPRDDGLIKNRYVARTFIQPGQELRKHGLRMKFNPLPEIVEGKRLVVVDDSIVRGNTTRQIIGMLRDAGASEVHLRISAPPIRHPCHYGVDMETRNEMIAHDRTVSEIAEELGADSLAYLSMEGVYEAVGTPAEAHCDACFTGSYPLGDDPDDADGKFTLEQMAVVGGGSYVRAGPTRARGRGIHALRPRLRRGDEPAGDPRPAARQRRDRGRRVSHPTNPMRRRSIGPRAGDPGRRPFRAPDPDGREARDAAMAEWIEERSRTSSSSPATCSCSTPAFVDRFADRIVNVHPALLPSFPGLDAVGQALEHGVKVTGVTVHFVDEGVDSGPIMLQRPVPVPPDRRPRQPSRRRSTPPSTRCFPRRSA